MATLPPLVSPRLHKATVALDLAARILDDLWHHAEERHPEWFLENADADVARRSVPAGDNFSDDVGDAADHLAFVVQVLDPDAAPHLPEPLAGLPLSLAGESDLHLPGIETAGALLRVGMACIVDEIGQHDDQGDRPPLPRFLDGLLIGLEGIWAGQLVSGEVLRQDLDRLDEGGELYAAADALVDRVIADPQAGGPVYPLAPGTSEGWPGRNHPVAEVLSCRLEGAIQAADAWEKNGHHAERFTKADAEAVGDPSSEGEPGLYCHCGFCEDVRGIRWAMQTGLSVLRGAMVDPVPVEGE